MTQTEIKAIVEEAQRKRMEKCRRAFQRFCQFLADNGCEMQIEQMVVNGMPTPPGIRVVPRKEQV
jgi:glucokinase